MRVVLDELEKNFEKTNSDTNQWKSIRLHSAGRLKPVRRGM